MLNVPLCWPLTFVRCFLCRSGSDQKVVVSQHRQSSAPTTPSHHSAHSSPSSNFDDYTPRPGSNVKRTASFHGVTPSPKKEVQPRRSESDVRLWNLHFLRLKLSKTSFLIYNCSKFEYIVHMNRSLHLFDSFMPLKVVLYFVMTRTFLSHHQCLCCLLSWFFNSLYM